MRVLLIPDIHLDPSIFSFAIKIMQKRVADQAVCLMDIPSNGYQRNNINLYKHTFDSAIMFGRIYPNTLWCLGDQELSYIYNFRPHKENPEIIRLTCNKIQTLMDMCPSKIKIVHRIDNVLFSHAGLSADFVRRYAPQNPENIDQTIDAINQLGNRELWRDLSPIWYHPQYTEGKNLYQPDTLLQVVGHTPMARIQRKNNLISCDVFTRDIDGKPIGDRSLLVIDTLTFTLQIIPEKRLIWKSIFNNVVNISTKEES